MTSVWCWPQRWPPLTGHRHVDAVAGGAVAAAAVGGDRCTAAVVAAAGDDSTATAMVTRTIWATTKTFIVRRVCCGGRPNEVGLRC